jgi:hypothetical protein
MAIPIALAGMERRSNASKNIAEHGKRRLNVRRYRRESRRCHSASRSILGPLRGKNLACFCAIDELFCHGDVLLEIANR